MTSAKRGRRGALEGLALLTSLLGLAPPGCSGEFGADWLCDPLAIQQALREAAPGEAVRLGACQITGPLVVPPGVRLAGVGRGFTILVAGAGEPPLVLQSGRPATSARGMSVETTGGVGLVALGPGQAVAQPVGHSVGRRVTLSFPDASLVELEDVALVQAAPAAASARADDDDVAVIAAIDP